MKIVKVFNNNVVMVLDQDQKEAIVMGRGLGFQKKAGDTLDDRLVDKVFTLADQSFNQAVSDLYVNISPQEVDILLLVIEEARQKLGTDLSENLYITLADHLHFAIARAKEHITLKNPLIWEVKKFYPVEYEIGLDMVAKVNQTFDLSIEEDEAASIALHFVNAQKNGQKLGQTIKIAQLLQELLDIVRRFYNQEFTEDNVSYLRFVTHLQYFAQRVVYGKHHEEGDTFLYEQIKLNYPKAFECASLIERYVARNYDFYVGKDELVYLTIHIQRSTSENK